MKKNSIDLNEMIASKNLGVINGNGKINLCFISKNDKNEAFAVSLSELVSVDASKVIPINDLFYEKHQPDGGVYSEKLACVGHNNYDIFKQLSDKSIVLLRNLSIYTPSMYWYSEDHGVSTVEVDENKEFKLKHILKQEEKINKIEKVNQKHFINSQVEMQ